MAKSKRGVAVFDGKVLHIDAVGWSMIKSAAKRTKKSPKYIVTAALVRCARKLNEKA